jgi:hypothetical protein
MFRDEWLEPAPTPASAPAPVPHAAGFVRVRSAEEIRATLDERGRTAGLQFMPEMYAHAGRRLRVLARLDSVYELDRAVPVAQPIYVLDGLYCSGAILGEAGPCDRGCRLLWHGDWLISGA